MKTTQSRSGLVAALIWGALALAPAVAAATKNPTSKLYVADLEGQSEIDTGERIEDLAAKSVHNAQGTVIQTYEESKNAMVFSNGTGVFLDPDTRVEVRRFVQEPFSPDRSDLEAEPSISQTSAYVPRGTVGLCTPKMVAGSTMNYTTPVGNVSIRNSKVVIQTDGFETKISLIDGDVTVRGGATDTGGQTLRGGQQAIMRNRPGQPPEIFIQPIPDDEMSFVEDKVTMACNARRTVYFDATGKKGANDEDGGGTAVVEEGTGSDEDGDGGAESDTEGGDLVAGADGGSGNGEGWANVFDPDQGGTPSNEIVVQPTTPVEPPAAKPVSASSI